MTLTTKAMEIKLKNGWGIERFMQELDISEEQFESELRRMYTSEKSFGEIINRLRSNDKRLNKLKKPKKAPTVHAESQTVPEEVTIENVSSLLEATSAKLSELQQKHKESISRKASLISERLKLEREIQFLNKSIADIIETCEEETLKQNGIKQEIKKCSNELAELSEKRKELIKVIIFVNSNGSIEANDNLLSDSDFSEEWMELYKSFYNTDTFSFNLLDSITGAQAKQLAKLLTYIKNLEVYEVCFDSPELEEVYNKLKP